MTPPSKATLRKYGLTAERWVALWHHQQGACAVCQRKGRPLQIDHHHRRGWKKLSPERRLLFVRGLVCWPCNRFLLGPVRYGMTPLLYRAAADYIEGWRFQADL